MVRLAWCVLAYLSLGLGIVGIFVPGLPTTVFVLIAAWAATHGSQRLHHWLLGHPRFGPAIMNWRQHRSVSRRGKRLATASMALCAAITLWCVPVLWLKLLSISCMAVVCAWLWARPLPPEERQR
jgi:uncharacterized membrane protein YbaN (DUF454 family)